ncbi:F-box/LRR-repeat protein 18-like [Crassostrea virginica]
MEEDNFNCLPDDLIIRIFSNVSTEDLCTIYNVSRRFRRLAFDRSLVRRSDFEQCYGITSTTFSDFIKCNCSLLETLSLNHCYWLTGRHVESAVLKCKQLTQLYVLDVSLSTKQLCKILSALTKLEALAFTVASVDEFDNNLNASESAQRTMCNIKHLTIHFKVGITPRTEPSISVQFIQKKNSFIEHCRELASLHVMGHPNLGCGLPKLLLQPNVVKVSNLKNLKHLSLNYAIDPAARIFYYGTLMSVAKLHLKLKTVLNPSANFSSERNMDFWKNFWISQDDLEYLDLSNISLKNIFPTIFDPGVVKKNLLYLNISHTDSREVGMNLATLGHVCPNLRSLNLKNSQLVYLHSAEQTTNPQQKLTFDIEGFSSLVSMCHKLVHLNLSNIHIHQLSGSQTFVNALTTLTGLRSLALSPCCLRLQDGEARGSEDGPGGSQSGKKHAASTMMVQYAKRRRISLSTAAHSSQHSALPEGEDDETDSASINVPLSECQTGLQSLTEACPHLSHLELISAGLVRPVIHRGSIGLAPRPCVYVPCVESYALTDSELSHLGRLANLQYLQLAGLPGIISGSFLSHLAKQCPQLKQLHLSYLGLTAHCIYTNQLCQALQYFTSLIDLRLEHAYLSIDQLFLRSAKKCKSLQRFCVVSKNGSVDPAAVTSLMAELPHLVVLQLFTDSTQTMCKKLMKALKDRFQSSRPALSVTIYPLFDQDTAYIMNKIPTKHLEELTIFSSKICQQPPEHCRVKATSIKDRSSKRVGTIRTMEPREGLLVLWLLSLCTVSSGTEHCRVRESTNLTDHAYQHTSCTLCYAYLIKQHDNPEFRPFSTETERCLRHSAQGYRVCPSTDNQTTMDAVCHTLTPQKCRQWTACCEKAWECCVSQKQTPTPGDGERCPRTWDGWLCWNDAPTGSIAKARCPSFLQSVSSEARALKNCTQEGRWWRSEAEGEHTDYSQCLSGVGLQDKIDYFKKVTVVRIAVNSVGLFLLCASVVLFLYYRQLRTQQRIKLHVHLFLSLLVRGIIELCWDVQIRYKRLEQDPQSRDETVCKFLYIMNRFGWSAPYYWMLCEGFFLHRLLIKTFERQKTLIYYYIFGWGTPVFLVVLYLSIKLEMSQNTAADTSTSDFCWLDTSSSEVDLYWIIFAPTLLCLALNLAFFINILRILIRQVRTLPTEPSNFRKALKATFILIPLFGLHQFFLIYQPTPDKDGYEFYQMAGAIINNAQGIVVAMMFCFLNGEVISHIKSSYDTLRLQQSIDRRKSLTSQTNTRRFSASSVNININHNGLPYVSSFHDLNDTLKLAEKNNIPMEELGEGIHNPGSETTENGNVQ